MNTPPPSIRTSGDLSPIGNPQSKIQNAPRPHPGWPVLWSQHQAELRRRRYAPATIRLHRQVLRGFSRFAFTGPASVTEPMVKAYVGRIARDRPSWSWTAANITVLRSAFDTYGGRQLTTSLKTPRRSYPLPEILSEADARAILRTGTCLRDRLLLGLLYGSGLKPGEAVALRWADLSPDASTLNLPLSRPRACPVRIVFPHRAPPSCPDSHVLVCRQRDTTVCDDSPPRARPMPVTS